MTIDEQMASIANELISKYGKNYKTSLREICEHMEERFGTNSRSVIPSDYCYNRVNKGINFDKKPRLFLFLGNGEYECIGEDYKFNGAVYTCERGTNTEVEVGYWKDGVLSKNKNWELYNLK